MSAKTVKCAKLGKELPAIDETSWEGQQAVKLCTIIGGPALKDRVLQSVSAEAWNQWKGHMIMVVNEFRLDVTSDRSNAILKQYMEDFFFGTGAAIPNYVPESK